MEDFEAKYAAQCVGLDPFGVIVYSSPIMLPLIDMFRNKEIEIDINLESIKVLYSDFKLPLLS